jgi:hypothetical protein
MSERVDISLVHEADYFGPTAGDIVCQIEVVDTTLIGHDAEFSIIAKVEVKDRRGVDDQRTLHTQNLHLSSAPVEIRIPRDEMRAFTYSGKMISMTLHTRLVVNDAILFDTKITEEQELNLGTKPSIAKNTQSIIDPSDAFNFFKNLQAIPSDAKFWTMILLVVGLVVIAVNTVIGIHDQISPGNLTWFYSHVDSDGDGSSPLMTSLAGSGALGAAIWFLIRHQLRKYMQFSLKKLPQIQRDGSYSLSDLVRGRSRTPLSDVTLRVVACNMELGQYRRGSGSSERTVSFEEPVRGLILYETTVAHIPANVPLVSYFDGPVDFEPMFAALYPPVIALTHGMAVHWEVQLLHPEFVDHELVGPMDRFRYADFLEG